MNKKSTSAPAKAKRQKPPWIGYVAINNSVPVGTCVFKSPPADIATVRFVIGGNADAHWSSIG